jgi:DNA repair protein RecO (recombination protein O)
MRVSRDITCQGIILRTTKYRNSSLLIDIFSRELGRITILAKSILSEKNQYYHLMEIGNELDWQIQKSESHLYYFRNAELQNAYLHSLSYENSLPLYAAIELYLQLVIPTEESEQFYQLLSSYFVYMQTFKQNGIVIFWRFLLRIFHIYGSPLNLQSCCLCHSELQTNGTFSFIHSGFVCEKCINQKNEYHYELSKEASDIISKLPKIGHFVNQLTLSPKTIKNINIIFLKHFEYHFHKTLHFKSLKSMI